MSESPESERPPDGEDDGWRFDFELTDRPRARGDLAREAGWVDAGEITDLGTGDDPPRSGE